ncbi:hypothetical protein CHLRE_15g641926v5 [Chlamydomonas reinhardtii]|uniref:Uncharacterized protein n=1 Tax=Chlamydomonas reinhardtii TaxID=3055 RepID=A0A2K3CWX5_CHLRE|nr:uncharacterized protein CHLRE_15g641926v5 [Chlamydomonas reinhardtii]PNW72778.1 hypothetical protein CHLRE_15g641926v5 [Chlamydomonas reinhardtii]
MAAAASWLLLAALLATLTASTGVANAQQQTTVPPSGGRPPPAPVVTNVTANPYTPPTNNNNNVVGGDQLLLQEDEDARNATIQLLEAARNITAAWAAHKARYNESYDSPELDAQHLQRFNESVQRALALNQGRTRLSAFYSLEAMGEVADDSPAELVADRFGIDPELAAGLARLVNKALKVRMQETY